MEKQFPDDGPLGRRTSIHGVRWPHAAAAHLLPAVFGVLGLVTGLLTVAGVIGLSSKDGKGGSSVGFFVLGALLVALSVWLVRRRIRRGPAAALYAQGLAIREGGEVRFLPW